MITEQTRGSQIEMFERSMLAGLLDPSKPKNQICKSSECGKQMRLKA